MKISSLLFFVFPPHIFVKLHFLPWLCLKRKRGTVFNLLTVSVWLSLQFIPQLIKIEIELIKIEIKVSLE
jgi:hypothetical protein